MPETRLRLLPVRVVWLVLPLLAGRAAAVAMDDWSQGARVVGATLLFLAWGAGVVALLAPRPLGLTVVRVVAPTFAVLAIVVALTADPSTLEIVGALVGTVAGAALVADPAVALAAADGVAYGEERRYPLRVPPALYLGPVPLARAVVAVGIASGPLLLADGRPLPGAIALVVGLPLAWLAGRSLQTLVRRWFVLVPAGIALVDEMTLADPVLFVRRCVRSVHAAPGTGDLATDEVDLRLGATLGTVVLETDGSVAVVRRTRGRREAETLHPTRLRLAVAGRDDLVGRAGARPRVTPRP